MKNLHVVMLTALLLGMAQFAYANHDGKDGMHTRHAMQDADTDNDGTISREEFNTAHQKMADEMFNKLDSNKDGKIEQSERDAMKEKMGKHCKMKDHKMNEMAK